MIKTEDLMTALSDRTRLNALHILWDGEEHCVCELMEQLGATQSRMSRHMKVFKTLGILLDRRDAQWVRYRRNPDLSFLTVQIIEATLSFDKSQKDKAA